MYKILFAFLVTLLLTTSCASNNPQQLEIEIDAFFEKSPVITPFSDKYWLLLEDLRFHIIKNHIIKNHIIRHDEYEIIVPAGFVCDLASIPTGLNIIYNKYGRYAAAGIVHDYLYWLKPCKKTVSDRIIKEALRASGSGFTARNTIKRAVKLGGKKAWIKNRKLRERGVSRFIPQDSREFGPNIRWEEYAQCLASKGKAIQLKEIGPQSYCNIF
jgi:hypothetical protein